MLLSKMHKNMAEIPLDNRVITIILLIGITFFLLGCDHFPGPDIRNRFHAPVKISIYKNDGEVYSFFWPTCEILGLGGSGADEHLKNKGGVNSIVIESNGRIIYILEKKEINSLSVEGKNVLWDIDEFGIKKSISNECTSK